MSEYIMVGVDGSPPAVQAVKWAAAEAVRRDRPLLIIHVVAKNTGLVLLRTMPGVFDSLVENGNRVLAEAEEQAMLHRPGLSVTTLLVDAGTPSEGLGEHAAEALEVVVGHRGLGGFAELLLGSTGLHIAGHLPAPVVIVRGDAPDGPGAEHGEVVVGVDLGQDVDSMLDYAVAVAVARGARLRVVHAWQPAPAVALEGFMIDVEEVNADYRDHLHSLIAPWQRRHPDLEILEQVNAVHPVPALTEASRRADLLVVGHHARRLPRLGSIGHGVLHHSACPVAVVPAPAH